MERTVNYHYYNDSMRKGLFYMKKFLPYFFSSTISLITAIVLSNTLHFPLSNSWQASIVSIFVFGPCWIYCWRYSPNIKKKHPFLFLFTRFCLLLLVIGFAISTILFFAEVTRGQFSTGDGSVC